MRFILVFLSISLSFLAYGQEKYWVFFKDKPHATQALQQVNQYFTPKALQMRNMRNIGFDQKDVRVNSHYSAQVSALANEHIRSSRWLNASVVTISDSLMLEKIKALPFVKEVRQIKSMKAQKNGTRLNLQLIDNQYASPLSGVYGDALPQLSLYNLLPLHNQGYYGEDIRVAVFDAGFLEVDNMLAFEKLRNDQRILATKDFVEGDNDVYGHHTHGTLVLSTMAANLPNQMVGAAPLATYLLFRTEDGASETLIEEDHWVAAAEYCDSIGVHIINSSLGYTEFDDTTQNHTYADMDGNTTIITKGADIAASKGILVVNSAGNSGNSSWKYISAPADGDSVLAVGAVTVDGDVAGFSSYGPSADGRVKPNICAVGELATVVGTNDETFQANGTSFASPLLAGAAACLWNAFPTASNMQLFDAIEGSGNTFFEPNQRCGYGIPNFEQASNRLLSSVPKWSFEPLKAYPNPANDFIYVNLKLPTNQEVVFEFYSIDGKLLNAQTHLMSQGFGAVSVNVQELPSSMIILKVITEQHTFRQQIFIQREE